MKSKPTYPNLVSRIFLKKPFQTQFIIPPKQPWLLVKFLDFYERSVLKPDVSNIRVDRPIFLLGIHRSGTTMVQDLLCVHPQVAYVNNVMPSFPHSFCAAEHLRKKLKLDFRGERMLDDSVELEAGSPNEGVALWREWLREDHHSLKPAPQDRSDWSEERVDDLFHNLRRILWCFEGKADRFFCKNPRLIPYVELLSELFPDAKFIHLVRDARTCANSMVKLYHKEQQQLDRIRAAGRHGVFDDKPFVAFPRLPRLAEYVREYGAPNIETTARLWNDAIDFITERKALLSSFYEVRYEDILEQPQEEVGRLLDFCELPQPTPDEERFWNKLKQVGVIHHKNQYENFARIEELCRRNLEKYNYL